MIDVAELRRAHKWTQQDLAEFMRVDRTTVSKWENGGTVEGPALVLLEQLASRSIPQDADCVSPAGPETADLSGPALSEEMAG